MTLLDDITARLGALSADQREELAQTVAPLRAKLKFVPQEGPQTQAYLSPADVLLYGGQAGGGKSALLVGLAQEHRNAILFRREQNQTDGLEQFGKAVYGTRNFNRQDSEWRWDQGRTLKLAGLREPDDWNKHAGRARDLIGFDEAGEFLRGQVGALLAWNRGPPGQRCRIVLASNPPRSADGYWLTEWFAPWLDLHHPHAAQPGELRWAVMRDGPDGLAPHWLDGPDPVEFDGEERKPLSFSFIPAALSDNRYLDAAYLKSLDNLPEPLRSQLKHGDWSAGVADDLDQAIPTDWVRAAQARWTPQPPPGVPLCAIGVDVAQGGGDQTVIAQRHDDWFAPLIAVPGRDTPGGRDVAGRVLALRHDRARVIVDLGGGWGGDALAHMVRNGIDAIGFMGVRDSRRRTRDNQLKFANQRTEAWWRLREALDPTIPGGASMALPPDRQLLADLTAPSFETRAGKGGMVIQLEPKDRLVKRLGRSPDKGDAVAMCWWSGAKAVSDLQEWRKAAPLDRPPQVVMRR